MQSRYPTPREIWTQLRKLDKDLANKERYKRYIQRRNMHRRKTSVNLI